MCAEEPAEPQVYVAVFDFAGSEAVGEQLADRLRLAIRRQKFEVIDRLTTQEVSGPLGVETEAGKAIDLMSNRLGANIGLYGTVRFWGPTVRVDVCIVDLTGESPAVGKCVFSDSTERAVVVIVHQIAETVTDKAVWSPPEYGDEAEPSARQLGRALNANGEFEAGRRGWERPDNVSTFIEPGPPDRGRVLRIRTDLARDPWLAYRRKLMFGQADPAKPPKIAQDSSYHSVAGLEGVHFCSDWIKAEPGKRYWMLADVKGGGGGMFFPKIFIKGFSSQTPAAMDGLPETSLNEMGLTPKQFAALPEARRKKLIEQDAAKNPMRYVRECYRWYLPCRRETRHWQHYAAPFPPRGGLPANVEWLQIQIYAYWPPGTYYFDNVNLYADPRQKAPLPEEKPRTPSLQRGKS
ncbi:MAG: hypothetical protein SVT52_08725 [Planctomycetota bacterium]|nr:hypothetical protein [Planctomycetota bacterium]